MEVSAIMTSHPTTVGLDTSLDETMAIMDAGELRHLPVVQDGKVVGILSERDLLEVTGWLGAAERTVVGTPAGRVERFMHSPVVAVAPGDSITKAVVRMASRHIGCVPVLEGQELVGILTETDVLKAFVESRRAGRVSPEKDPPVRLCMSPEVIKVAPETDAEEVVAAMQEHNVRHLVVLQGEEIVGIVSDRDIRRAIGQGTLDEVAIRGFMTERPFLVASEDPMSKACQAMIDGKVGALPVVDANGKLAGILSLPDAFATCLDALA